MAALTKQLLCPACPDVIGIARLRRWPRNLVIQSVDGYRTNPIGAAVLRRITERELADATDPAEPTAQARLEYVVQNITDPIFDVRCGRGLSTLRTSPAVAHVMRTTAGAWATV